MALTTQMTSNVQGASCSISFSNPNVIDEISFGTNQVTFKKNAGYSLTKEDFVLFINNLNVFFSAVQVQYPSINSFQAYPLPQCENNFKVGSTRITYSQISGVNKFLELTYLLSNNTMSSAARAIDMTITVQEFFLLMNNLGRITQQISAN